jgi:hypothetical protein
MQKQEIISVFLVRALPQDREELRRKLERMTLDELEEAHRVIQIQATEEKLLQIQAERAADAALFNLRRQREREPQRVVEEKAQLARDRQTFAEAAKTLRSFGVTEANFDVCRKTLGEGFSVFQIQEMLTANGATLSVPTQPELDEWTRQDIEAHNLRLLSMDIPSLRKLAREAGARGPATPQPDETQRIRAAERNDGVAYPPLPDEIRIGDGAEEVLDASFVRRCSKETLRFLIQRYGSDQINEALRTRRPEVSPLWLA